MGAILVYNISYITKTATDYIKESNVMAKNQVTVTILGQRYSLIADGTEEAVRAYAAKVNRDVTAAMDKYPQIGSTTAAVLTSLDYLEGFETSKDEIEALKSALADANDATSEAREEIYELQRTVNELRAETVMLNDRIETLKKKQSRNY